jgi:hypothetical protein
VGRWFGWAATSAACEVLYGKAGERCPDWRGSNIKDPCLGLGASGFGTKTTKSGRPPQSAGLKAPEEFIRAGFDEG